MAEPSPRQVALRPDVLPPRLPSLTGMRFLAATMVFSFHSMFENLFAAPKDQHTFNSIASQGGWVGVSFFFVLSGFVLTWSARPGDTPQRFWRRRFFKIYPNHVITFVAALMLTEWVSKVAVDNRAAILNLLLLQSWFPDSRIVYSVNVVAWSLSCEAFFYLCFPFLLRLISRIRPERLWAWACGMVAGVVVVAIVATMLPSGQVIPEAGLPWWQLWFSYLFPPVRMLEFVFGILLARIVMSGRKLPLGLGGSVAFAVAAYALAPLFPKNFSAVAVMVLPLGLVIAAGAVADVAQQGSWLSSRVMVWLGEMSFAFYLWHVLVLTNLGRWLGAGTGWNAPVALAVLALLFGVTLLLSSLLFSLVERPVLRRFGTSRRRPRPTEEPTAATLAG